MSAARVASVLHGARRLTEGLAVTANAVGTLVVLALVAVVNFDVVARGAFAAPFMGAVEVVQFSVVLIVFLQLPDVVRVNRLTRSDGFLILLRARAPGAARLLSGIIDIAAAIFMGLICWTIYPEFVETLHNGRFMGIDGVFSLLRQVGDSVARFASTSSSEKRGRGD